LITHGTINPQQICTHTVAHTQVFFGIIDRAAARLYLAEFDDSAPLNAFNRA
jgi:hypothetical protein